MRTLQCRATVTGQRMSHIDPKTVQARQKQWQREHEQRKQKLLAKINAILGDR